MVIIQLREGKLEAELSGGGRSSSDFLERQLGGERFVDDIFLRPSSLECAELRAPLGVHPLPPAVGFVLALLLFPLQIQRDAADDKP